jgi:hypothetical protein
MLLWDLCLVHFLVLLGWYGMTDEQITRIIEAIEILSKETDVEGKEIIDLLTGFCWDEEDGFRIKRQLLGEDDDD